jgi:hypothetical protein
VSSNRPAWRPLTPPPTPLDALLPILYLARLLEPEGEWLTIASGKSAAQRGEYRKRESWFGAEYPRRSRGLAAA